MKEHAIAIVGATGFTGSELVRLLHAHNGVKITAITSETHQGKAFSEVHSFFEGLVDFKLQSVEALDLETLDLIFLALPHGVSMEYVRKLKDSGTKIIDLSGDFRLSGPEVYAEWYQKTHIFPEGFGQAVYGLPELHLEKIQQASLVANPGCYPTASILAMAPLIDKKLAGAEYLIIDAKSGVTGAGVKASPTTHFSNVNDNFKAYGMMRHRHSIEIEEQLAGLSEEYGGIQFTPHLLPLDRGILATCYVPNRDQKSAEELQQLYKDYYQFDPFVRIRSQPPTLKDVRGTNYCDVYITADARTGNVLVVSAIDNLIKGAAGQAIQNMNLMMGFQQTEGLLQIPLQP
jgi:N-acetyl-gamma-glutamyl-phosphate reductase